MNAVLLFLIAISASTVGAITGIGGGIIVKPVVDMLGLLSIESASFMSGCMVLSMALVSLCRGKTNGKTNDLKTLTPLAVGAAFGGIFGNLLFKSIKENADRDELLVFWQSVVLLVLVVGVFIYIQLKPKIKTLHLRQPAVIIIAGLLLGGVSSFLGIGGGPINLFMLYFLFSMDEKTAAVGSLYVIVFSQTASLIFTVATQTVPRFDPICLFVMLIGGIAGGFIGSFVLKKISRKCVSYIFQFLLIVIIFVCGLNMVWRL